MIPWKKVGRGENGLVVETEALQAILRVIKFI
jgi:hypothetical protein